MESAFGTTEREIGHNRSVAFLKIEKKISKAVHIRLRIRRKENFSRANFQGRANFPRVMRQFAIISSTINGIPNFPPHHPPFFLWFLGSLRSAESQVRRETSQCASRVRTSRLLSRPVTRKKKRQVMKQCSSRRHCKSDVWRSFPASRGKKIDEKSDLSKVF